MARFFLIFLMLVAGLFSLELLPAVQKTVVLPFTSVIATVSAALMRLFDDQVLAFGKVLWDQGSGFSVSIEPGCNGVEASIILIAAMLAFPSSWTSKVIGILVGMLTVQSLNLLRIVTLFYLGQWSRTLFEWAHLYVWQALIVLDVLLVFLVWLRWQARPSAAHQACATSANPTD